MIEKKQFGSTGHLSTRALLGVTGHGISAPWMHLKSLEKYPFNSVLLPYNYTMLQYGKYVKDLRNWLLYVMRRTLPFRQLKLLLRDQNRKTPGTNLQHGTNLLISLKI